MPHTRCTAHSEGATPRASTRVLGFDPGADREEGPGERPATAGRAGCAGHTSHVWHGCGRFSRAADERVGALPVVDADGKLIGIVSYVDALRALAP